MRTKEKPKGEMGEEDARPRVYYFKICPTCGRKMHVDQSTCHGCGGWHHQNERTGEPCSGIYRASLNPEDALYSRELNNPRLCVSCDRAIRGNPCKTAFYGYACFATKLGSERKELCEKRCQHDYPERYRCCRQALKDFPPKSAEEVNAFLETFLKQAAVRGSASV